MPNLSLFSVVTAGIIFSTAALVRADEISDKYWSLTPEHFRDSVTLKDDRLNTVAVLSTVNGFQVKQGLIGWVPTDSFLRAFIDKKTGKTTFQVYEISHYFSPNWHFYERANYLAASVPQSVAADVIDREVEGCGYAQGCLYLEQVGFPIDEARLRIDAASYVPGGHFALIYKFTAHDGAELPDVLSSAEITGLLMAVDRYRTTHNIASAETSSASQSPISAPDNNPAAQSAAAPANTPGGVAARRVTADSAPTLGVNLVPTPAFIASQTKMDRARGLLIINIAEKSAAARAGLLRGDVILTGNGTPWDNTDELAASMNVLRAGDTLTLSVWSAGAEKTVRVKF